ncbi:hypothetical protein F5Y06DRAFT_303272 [Hypoxylon sp. FL0890]|nr:hypothetical protein F5Y06DRAFT_303272 [Hypoxylon sp. FL0890]
MASPHSEPDSPYSDMDSPSSDRIPTLDSIEEIVMKQIHLMAGKKLTLAAVAGQLGILFDLSLDPMEAQQKMQGLLKHPAFIDAVDEFSTTYLNWKWDLPVGEWWKIEELIKAHKDDVEWTQHSCPETKEWTVNHFYARFVIRTFHEIKCSPLEIAHWLREAPYDDAIYILAHVLMFLQLDCMRVCKQVASFKDRMDHLVDTCEGADDTVPSK